MQDGNLSSFNHYQPDAEEGVIDLTAPRKPLCPQLPGANEVVPLGLKEEMAKAWRGAVRAWVQRQLGPPATVVGVMNASALGLIARAVAERDS